MIRVHFIGADGEKRTEAVAESGQSLLEVAQNCGMPLEGTCEGQMACSTCHVIVKQGLESCSEGTDDEYDQLDEAPMTTLQSRLGCQCVPNGTKDIVVEIPAVNKNLVREGH